MYNYLDGGTGWKSTQTRDNFYTLVFLVLTTNWVRWLFRRSGSDVVKISLGTGLSGLALFLAVSHWLKVLTAQLVHVLCLQALVLSQTLKAHHQWKTYRPLLWLPAEEIRRQEASSSVVHKVLVCYIGIRNRRGVWADLVVINSTWVERGRIVCTGTVGPLTQSQTKVVVLASHENNVAVRLSSVPRFVY